MDIRGIKMDNEEMILLELFIDEFEDLFYEVNQDLLDDDTLALTKGY